MAIRVLLAEDHPTFRAGLKGILGLFEDIEVVFEAENGRQALAGLNSHKPDVLVLDISMPEMNGIEVMKYLQEHQIHVPVLILSAFVEESYVKVLLDLGVHGYLTKNELPETIAQAIQAVAKGELGWMSPQVNRVLKNIQEKRDKLFQLSDREQEVLNLISEGKTNVEIAEALFISPHTIKNHITNIFQKLGYKNRVDFLTEQNKAH